MCLSFLVAHELPENTREVPRFILRIFVPEMEEIQEASDGLQGGPQWDPSSSLLSVCLDTPQTRV